MDEYGLIKSAAEGNRHDFELLVKKYQSAVFRTAMGMVHDKEDAEEITQDVFLKIYRSLSSFENKSVFSTWLYRITVNTGINFLRKKKRKVFWQSLSEALHIPALNKLPDAKLQQESDKTLVGDMINRLPEKQRVAFVLSRYEELPQKRIAAVMGLSEGAVEQLLIRAKANLRKKISEYNSNA